MSRPVLPWYSPYVVVPLDGALVWIRRTPWYDTPVRASFHAPDSWSVEVPSVDTLLPAQILTVASMVIHSWKFQYLSDQQAYDSSRNSPAQC